MNRSWLFVAFALVCLLASTPVGQAAGMKLEEGPFLYFNGAVSCSVAYYGHPERNEMSAEIDLVFHDQKSIFVLVDRWMDGSLIRREYSYFYHLPDDDHTQYTTHDVVWVGPGHWVYLGRLGDLDGDGSISAREYEDLVLICDTRLSEPIKIIQPLRKRR